MTPPRWRSRLRLLLLLGELLALLALLLVALGAFRLPCARLRLGPALGARGVFGASGRLEAALGGAGGDPGLDRLDLGDVAGDRDLGVVLGARLVAALAAGALAAPALRGRGARPCAVRGSSPSAASASPCARCGGRTSGRTCAARSGPASSAATCWSGSCAACSLRKRASPRCGHLREPFLPRSVGRRYKEKPRAEARGWRRIAPDLALARAVHGGAAGRTVVAARCSTVQPSSSSVRRADATMEAPLRSRRLRGRRWPRIARPAESGCAAPAAGTDFNVRCSTDGGAASS